MEAGNAIGPRASSLAWICASETENSPFPEIGNGFLNSADKHTDLSPNLKLKSDSKVLSVLWKPQLVFSH